MQLVCRGLNRQLVCREFEQAASLHGGEKTAGLQEFDQAASLHGGWIDSAYFVG